MMIQGSVERAWAGWPKDGGFGLSGKNGWKSRSIDLGLSDLRASRVVVVHGLIGKPCDVVPVDSLVSSSGLCPLGSIWAEKEKRVW